MIKWPKERKLDPDYSGEYWQECKGFNEGVRACKQSLNQASEEDEVKKLFREFYEWFDKETNFTNSMKSIISDRANDLMWDILKEYILVKR